MEQMKMEGAGIFGAGATTSKGESAAQRESIQKILDGCNSFEEFFIEVSRMKVAYDFDGLGVLNSVVKEYAGKYGSEAVVYLSDSIIAERALPCKGKRLIRKQSRKRKGAQR